MHPALQRKLVTWFTPNQRQPVLSAGGGEFTLVDDLIGKGYLNVTVMDISRTAIEHSEKRVGQH